MNNPTNNQLTALAMMLVTVLAVCTMLCLSTAASAQQWVNVNGMAMSYKTDTQSALSVMKADGGIIAIAFNDQDNPVYNTSGDYRLVVDGKYVTLTGIGAGGSWVCMDLLDSDVSTAVRMLKNGSKVTLKFCFGGQCNTIYTSSLSGSAGAINQVL